MILPESNAAPQQSPPLQHSKDTLCSTAKSVFAVWIILCFMALPDGYCQPVFYSQSLHKLYYSLPVACRMEIPVADTVVHCSGIVSDGAVPVAFCWDEYNVLAHIGYRFLPGADMLQAFNPAVVRFLEREMLTLLATDDLEHQLAVNRDNGLMIALNGNTPQAGFYRSRTGLPYLLQQVSSMNIRYEDRRRYMVELQCGADQTLTFQFVADAELLSDMDKKERDDRVAAQLSHHRAKAGAPSPHVPACSGGAMQTYGDSAFVCRGSSFIIPQINNNLYYTKTDGAYQLAFGSNRIAESFSNILLASSQRSYTFQVTQGMYGGNQHRYELNSRDFFDYFSDGYERYFGIEKLDRDMLAGTLIFTDKNAGTIHLAYITVSVLDLLTGGTMKIHLTANIPLHNVETIFGKKREGSGHQFKLNI